MNFFIKLLQNIIELIEIKKIKVKHNQLYLAKRSKTLGIRY